MCSLAEFPPLPSKGNVFIARIGKQLISKPIKDADVKSITRVISTFPVVFITRDLFRPASSRDDVTEVFLPVSETTFKRAIKAWYEKGYEEALHVIANEEQPSAPVLRAAAVYMLRIIKGVNQIQNAFYPHLREHGLKLITAVSHTRDWETSPVRCMAWHPHCVKIAVAIRDDSVRVYSAETALIPVLKYRNQRGIACMAWRPLSISELAVACLDGVYIWVVDPSSLVTRPSIASTIHLTQSGHSPVTGISWSPEGDVLLTASAADTTMYVWDIAKGTYSAVKRVQGGGVSLVSWSPDANRVFAATTGIIFRVWNTKQWVPERWTVNSGRVHAACWSPCGTHLLFTTSKEAVVFSLTFAKIQVVFEVDADAISKVAFPLIDVSAVELESGERVGGLVKSMVWDHTGNYLAIMFESCDVIAVYETVTQPLLQVKPCCFISGVSEEVPNVITFQQNASICPVLTIAWSSGRVQYFPFTSD